MTCGEVQVPEHTWGLDTREALPDFTHWGNAAFHSQLEDNSSMYLRTVASWKEQKSFVEHAISALDPEQVWPPPPIGVRAIRRMLALACAHPCRPHGDVRDVTPCTPIFIGDESLVHNARGRTCHHR